MTSRVDMAKLSGAGVRAQGSEAHGAAVGSRPWSLPSSSPFPVIVILRTRGRTGQAARGSFFAFCYFQLNPQNWKDSDFLRYNLDSLNVPPSLPLVTRVSHGLGRVTLIVPVKAEQRTSCA